MPCDTLADDSNELDIVPTWMRSKCASGGGGVWCVRVCGGPVEGGRRGRGGRGEHDFPTGRKIFRPVGSQISLMPKN